MGFYLRLRLYWVIKIIRLIFRVRLGFRRIRWQILMYVRNRIKYRLKKFRKNHSFAYNALSSISHYKISSTILTVNHAILSNAVNARFLPTKN